MTVVLSRPYKFEPPDYGTIWPWIIQRLRLYVPYLKNKEGVVDFECRGLEHFRASIDRGDGILLAPNHSRYGDPLVLGWPLRILDVNVFAMASWHLFNEGSFNAFAIRKMGAFSLYREGTDRQALETAIGILATAARPLIVFPEGASSRTNDYLIPLLEGVTFITRSAARRRAKKSEGRVVVLPVAIKYLCQDNVQPWAEQQLDTFESRLGWRSQSGQSLLNRTMRVFEAFLSLQEIEHLGHCQSGNLTQRREALIERLVERPESRLGLNVGVDATPGDRIRQIRTEAASRFFDDVTSGEEKDRIRDDVLLADAAQQLMLIYPECYLTPESITDTRIVEMIQRLQECFDEKFDASTPLKVVIEFDETIEVPAEKAPRGQEDPVLQRLHQRLTTMLERLATEARPLPS